MSKLVKSEKGFSKINKIIKAKKLRETTFKDSPLKDEDRKLLGWDSILTKSKTRLLKGIKGAKSAMLSVTPSMATLATQGIGTEESLDRDFGDTSSLDTTATLAPSVVDSDLNLSPRSKFKKYLTKTGIKHGIIRAIVALYEEPGVDKPDDPGMWIAGLLGMSLIISISGKALVSDFFKRKKEKLNNFPEQI